MSQNRKAKDIFKVLFLEKSILKFSITAIIGLAFSVAVILSAIGLMDGFEFTLKKSLQTSDGDLYISKKNSYLSLSDLEMLKKQSEFQVATGVLQGQGFLISQNESFGIMLYGVEPYSFNRVTDLKLGNLKSGIAVGSALAEKLDLKIGDDVALVLAKGNDAISDEPLLKSFKIQEIFDHKIYEKSLRFIFIDIETLRESLGNQTNFNQVKVVVKDEYKEHDQLEKLIDSLRENLGESYSIKPFWHDFEILLEAVGVEKKTIGLILQLIVLISLFNVIALFIYLTEKKAQDIFMLRALGVNNSYLVKILTAGALIVWLCSCILALLFKDIFKVLLQDSSWFKLPGEIYYLTGIDLSLTLTDYVLVFGISFCWLLLILLFMIKKVSQQSIMSGLRKG